MVALAPAVAAALVLSGCAARSEATRMTYAYEPQVETSGAAYGGAMDSEAATASIPADDWLADSVPAGGSERLAATGTATAAGGTAAAGETPAVRLRVYSADLRLAVTATAPAVDAATTVAEQFGGYVERATGDAITIRVPAADFDAAVEAVSAIGTVRERAIRTADVTEQFADLQRRIAIAAGSRERLYALLEQAVESSERVSILREIQRLTEQIERDSATLATVAEAVRMSRITVEFEPLIATTGSLRQRIPFAWIAGLDPIYGSLDRLPRSLRFDPGDDFAIIESGRDFFAEGFDGTRVRLGSTDNQPRGSAAFWLPALNIHLPQLYGTAQQLNAGRFVGVRFAGGDLRPYVYAVLLYVGTSTRGGSETPDDTIIVAELWFPSPEIAQQRLQPVLDALAEVQP